MIKEKKIKKFFKSLTAELNENYIQYEIDVTNGIDYDTYDVIIKSPFYYIKMNYLMIKEISDFFKTSLIELHYSEHKVVPCSHYNFPSSYEVFLQIKVPKS